jgi:hypothetical protein
MGGYTLVPQSCKRAAPEPGYGVDQEHGFDPASKRPRLENCTTIPAPDDGFTAEERELFGLDYSGDNSDGGHGFENVPMGGSAGSQDTAMEEAIDPDDDMDDQFYAGFAALEGPGESVTQLERDEQQVTGPAEVASIP